MSLLAVLLLLAACGQKPGNTAGNVTPTPGGGGNGSSATGSSTAGTSASPEYLQTQVVFTTGDVRVFQASKGATKVSTTGTASAPTATTAEIGMLLNPEDRIVVGQDSYCEIQFGNLAVTRIQADSDVVIGSLSPAGAPDGATVALTVGSVVSKVRKTVEGESFQVRTRAVTCGVRGTRFAVSSADTGDTTLAVSEGTVAVTPPTDQVKEMEAEAQKVGPDATQAVDKVAKSLPMVTAGYQLVITKKEADAMTEKVQTVAENLKAVAAAPEAEKQQKVTALAQSADTATRTMPAAVPVAATLDPQSQDLLKHADTMEIKPLPAPPASTATAEQTTAAAPAQPKEQANPPTVAAKPATAPATAPAAVAAPAPVPAPAAAPPATPPQTQQKPVETPKVAAAPPAATKPAPVPTGTLSFSVSPSDATVRVDGKRLAGSGSPEFPAGTSVTITVERAGFSGTTMKRVVGQGANTVSVALEPRPIERMIAVGSSGIVGGEADGGGVAYVAGANGGISAVQPDGRVLWTASTSNTGNSSSIPVAGGGYAALSGTQEFAVFNSATGAAVYRMTLNGSTAHPFGQRAAFANGLFYYPDTTGISIIDPRQKAVTGQIAVPSGIWMTPAVVRGTLYAVNQQGSLYEINLGTSKITSTIPTQALQPVGSTVTIHGDLAAFAGRRGTVVCVNLTSGSVAWQHDLGSSGGSVYSDILAGASDAFVYAGSQIHALSWKDGSPSRAPITDAATPPALVGGMLVYGATDGTLAVVSASSGKELYRLPLDAKPSGRPVVDERRILVPTASGSVVVVNADGLAAAAGSN